MGSAASEAALFAVVKNNAPSKVSETAALVAYKASVISHGRVTEGAVLVAHANDAAARTSELAISVAYKTNIGGLALSRAWTFTLDGHTFYVLNLGVEGTFVYDDTTGMWAQFQTGGYGIWNMLFGHTWGLYIIGGDAVYAKTWAIAPDSPVDEDWRPVEHKVNGGLPSRSRDGVPHDALFLTISSGFIGEDGARLQMRFSDDQGRNWSDYYDIDLVRSNYAQEITWRSLGSIASPGRIFEVRDVGGMIRIDDANATINGQTDDG